MIRSTAKPLLALGAVAALTFGASGTARANDLTMNGYVVPALLFEISHKDFNPDPNGTGQKGDFFSTYAGIFDVDYTTKSKQKVTLAVCSDIFKETTKKTDYVEHPLSDLPSPANAFEIGGLVHKYLGTSPIQDANHAAGFNLAIWELMYDSSPDLGDGTFRVNSSSLGPDEQAAYDAAGDYLTEAKTLNSTQGLWLTSSTYQNLLISNPIPEPAFYQFGAFCLLGGMTVWRRRRR